VQLVFERSLSTLLPFVPILQGGGEETQVRRAVQSLQQDEELSELESLLAFFASYVLDTELVAQILRWDMVVLRESPWYQEILQEGKREGQQEGLEQGLERGLEQGLEQGKRSLILRLLDRKLGVLPPDIRSQVEVLSVSQLEVLGEALLEFSAIADLITWLQAH
jgi:predicted transposase YdaD